MKKNFFPWGSVSGLTPDSGPRRRALLTVEPIRVEWVFAALAIAEWGMWCL